MTEDDVVKLRRTDWNWLVYGKEQGPSEGRGFQFVYEDEAEEARLLNYFWLHEEWEYDPDDYERPEGVPEAEWDPKQAFLEALAEHHAAQQFLDRIDMESKGEPWVALSPADLEHLRELISETPEDWNLTQFLSPLPDDEPTVTVSARDYERLGELAQLATRDMPADEPKSLDYVYIIQRYS